MGRIRSIKPELFFDKELADLGQTVQLFFIGLLCQADREGRGKDQPDVLRANIYPYNHRFDAERTMQILAQERVVNGQNRPGFVVRYRVKGSDYYQITKFKEHQRPHHTEKPSGLPSPSEADTLTEHSHHASCILPPVLKEEGREGKGKERVNPPKGAFDLFWISYPRKEKKKKAKEVWDRLNPDMGLFTKIMESITAQKKNGCLNREEKYIPHPTTWLNAGQWDDEVKSAYIPPRPTINDVPATEVSEPTQPWECPKCKKVWQVKSEEEQICISCTFGKGKFAMKSIPQPPSRTQVQTRKLGELDKLGQGVNRPGVHPTQAVAG